MQSARPRGWSSSRLLRRLATTAAATVLATGCTGVSPVGDPSNRLPPHEGARARVHWPAGYDPAEADFYVNNSIDVAASPDVVWQVLIEAETWPSWYEGAANVDVAHPSGLLQPGGAFSWQTMGLDLTSTIEEFEPPHRLSWESRISTLQGYHAWLIVPIAGGVRVVTVESQHGFLATMQRWFLPDELREIHDLWLAGIKARAEARMAAAGASTR